MSESGPVSDPVSESGPGRESGPGPGRTAGIETPAGSETTAGVDQARAIFGSGLELAERYAELLRGPGTVRGLIGPREGDRLWDRHLLNSAVVAELLPPGALVVDVGSGAGLPGLPMACARPDLRFVLVDTLRRRTDFLSEVVADLGLVDRVRVVTGRVEDPVLLADVGPVEWVTARAVAPLDRLARWCLPLLHPGGVLLAIKGRQAEREVADHAQAVSRAGGTISDITRCGGDILTEPTRVIRIHKRS